MLRKSLAWLLTIMMVISMFPISVFATDDTGNTPNIEFIDNSFEEPANEADVNDVSGEPDVGVQSEQTVPASTGNVAKVGSTEYATIDEAIANWTNNTTLTLLANVTLSDVIQLSSTEYHVLDLGTYTMTAASKKDAIQIVNNGRSKASYALDIKADATNPGGITATGKAVVKTTGKSGVQDRPIIRFYNGVFTGSNVVYHSGSNGTNCPQFWFYGGEFNGTVSANRAKFIFYGGTFNGSLYVSVDSNADALIVGGKFKQLSNLYGSSLNTDKFTIGSAAGVYDKEVYVDNNGYYVVATTEPTEGFEAAVAKTPGTNDYLAYSKVATEGVLNYTNAKLALQKNNSTSAKVTVYVDELDMAGISYKGTIVVPEGKTLKITNAPEGLKTEGNAVIVKPVAKIGDTKYMSLEEAFAAAQAGETITLVADATPALTSQRAITKAAVIDLGGKTLTLKEDDLYFGTTTFKNGTIVVDPSVKPSTAVFWMFANQTLTFDGVKIVATGVTGTYLIGLDGNNSDLNLLNGSEIVVENTTALDLDIICVNASTGNDIVIENSKVNVKNLDGRVFFRGNYTISGTSEIALEGITKAGFRIEAGQTLSIEDTASVTIEGEPRDGGIHLTDLTATYTKAETATVNATVSAPKAVAMIGETKYATLQAAINAVENGQTITLVGDVTENVTLTEKTGLYYTIDGNGKTMNGTITVDSLSDTNDNRRITIKNIKFVNNSDAGVDFVSSVNTNHYPRLTVEGCTFTGNGKATDVALRLKSSHSVVIKGCTGTGLHSFLQNTSGWNLTIENVTVTDSKGGLALGTVQSVTVKGCTIDVDGYGIRLDADTYNNNAVIESCTVKAFIPVVVRKANHESDIKFNGTNTMEATNTDGIWMAIGTSEYEENGKLPTAATGDVNVTVNDTYLNKNGIYGVVLNGSGTKEDPYLINNVNDLIFFRNSVNAGDTKYNAPGVVVALGADINMAGVTWERGIGDGINATFDGIFDGNNKTIMNLNFAPEADSDGYLCGGLFGYTYGAAVIKNLVLENITVTATDAGHNVGILVGFANNNGGKLTVSNVTVKNVTIDAPNAYGVGAIVGYSYRDMGTIEKCTVDGATITGYSFVGGITGYSYTGAVLKGNTVNNATITATSKGAGGIAGLVSGGSTVTENTVTNTTVTVTTNWGYVVGELGANSADISNNTASEPQIGGDYATGEAYQAKIGNKYYTSLQAAIDAANADETITLLADIEATEVILIGKSITINGNGHKVTSSATRVFRVTTSNVEVTLNDVNMVSRTVMIYPNDVRGISIDAYLTNVKLTLNDCSVDFTDASACDWAYAVNVSGNGTGHIVTVNGGTYEGANVINVHGASNTVVVKNATLTSLYPNNDVYYGACIWVLQNQGSEVEATGNTFNGYNAIAFNPGTGTTLTESNNTNNTKKVVAKIGDTYYTTLEEAFTAANAGDEIVLLADVAEDVTVPAGVIFNGNEKQVGVITAAGEITFKGHTKTTNFGTKYANTTINIIEGACLELTGTGRMVIGHGCTFNITGTITDAKTADKATIQPSLIVAAGASFTGTNLTFNITNAYVKFNGNSTSKNSNANGTFNFNVTNSIWEQTGVLAFYVPTSGMDPVFNLTLKDSVLTTTSHLVFSVTKGEIVIDNSNVNVGKSNQIENRSTMTIKNGSVVNGAVATSSNAINPGTIIVENATYAVTGQFSGAAEGTGTLIIKKGANVSVGSIKDKANVVIDAAGMTAGDEVNFTGKLTEFTGTIEVVNNDKLEAKIVDGKIVLTAKPVAEVNGVKYVTVAEAIAAAQNGDTVILYAGEFAPINISNKNITIQGTVGDNGELLTTIKGGNPAITGHGFNGTIKNLKIVDAFKVMYAEPAGNVTVDNVYVTGATYGLHLVAYSTGLTWTIQNSYMDLSWANSFGVYGGGGAAIVIKGNVFESTSPYYPDYGALHVNTFLPNVTVEGNVFGENAKIKIDGSITDTSKINISKNYHADGVDNAFVADSGVKTPILEYYADEAMTNLVKRYVQIGTEYYATLAEAVAAAQVGDEIVLLTNATVEGTLAIPAGVTIKSNGYTVNGSIRMLGDLTLNGALTITGGLWVGKSGETMTATLSGDKLTASYFMFQCGTYTINADIDAVYGYLSYNGIFEVNSTIHTTGANGEVLYINGNVTLNDGAVLDSDNSVFLSNNNAVLTMKPGSKVDSNLNITVSGAKLFVDAIGLTVGEYTAITGTVTNKGTIEVVNNDKLEAKIVDGKIVLAVKPVAEVNGVKYTDISEAFKAATSGCTIKLLNNVVFEGNWDDRQTATGMWSKFTVPVTIDGNGKTIKVIGQLSDPNGPFLFKFEADATVKNLTIDISEVTNAKATAISAKADLAVDGCTFIGNGGSSRGVRFGEGAGAAIGEVDVTITNSTFKNFGRGITDNENGQDAKTVTITGNTLENASVYVSAASSVLFNNNNVENGSVDIRSYAGNNAVLSVEAEGNTLSGGTYYIFAKTIDAQSEFTTKKTPFMVSTKAELDAALAAAKDGYTIIFTADIDYGTDQLAITKAITLDLGGKTLTTRNAYGGMSVKNNPTIKNGTIVHASNTAAIKVWNATAFEDLVIDVQGKGDANKTIGGIVLQSGSTTRVGSIKNVTIKGAALTNGIETYNCGDATENVIGSMENVTIDAVGTAMNISAPVGTATGCTFDGGTNGIELWIKGTYSATLTLVDCDVVGGVYAHDEFSSNPDIVNNGTLNLTVDEDTTVDEITLELARAENVEGKLEEIKDNAQAKVNNVYYATLAEAMTAAKAGDVVTVFAGTYAMPSMKAGITIVGDGDVIFEGTLTGTLENLTLKNIHIKGGNAQRWAYAKGNLVFENVTFEATSVYALHFDGITEGTTLSYKNCTIIGWAAMSGSPESCVFDGCTFKGNGTYGLIRTYFDATIENCTFDVANVNTTDAYQDGIHAVNGAKVTVTSCTNVNGSMKNIVNVGDTSVVVLDGVEIKNVAKIGDNYYLTLAEAFAAAQDGDEVAILAAGTYKVPTGKNITITGAVAGVVFDNIGAHNMGGANVTFNNVTFTYADNSTYKGLQHAGNLVYNNCTFNGQVFLYGASETFNKCTFNNTTNNYNVWTYGAKEVAFNECTFNSAGKAVLIYAESASVTNDVTVTGCTFNASSAVEGKAAIEMDSSLTAGIKLTIANSTATGFGTGNVSGNSLWNNKKGSNTDANNDITVVVNGETVLAPVKFVAKIGEIGYATLADAFAAVGAGDVVIELVADATFDYNARDAYGTADTTSLTINGNNHVLTLNQKNSDWASIGLANAGAKLVLNDMTIEKTGYGDTSGAWNTHAIIFSANVEMNNVTVNNAIAVQNGATLTNVTINEANGFYGLWINGNGQTVTMNGGAINATNGGRGIKIADQYIDSPAFVTLTVDGTKFSTAKKAAVLVSSKAGADITASNVDITNVSEDSVNFVWVDEDWAAYYGEVTVTGGTLAQENAEEFTAAIVNGDKVIGYYKTLQAAINAVAQETGTVVIKLLKDSSEDVTVKQYEGLNYVLDGNGKNYSGTITIHGYARYEGEETLTIKNFHFTTSEAEHYFIDSNSTGSVERYAHNVTVEQCTFTATGEGVKSAVAMRIRQGFDISMKSCLVNNLHSAFQGYGCAGFTAQNVTVDGCKNGFSVGTSTDAVVQNCVINVDGYGVRADGTGAYELKVMNSEITANYPVIVRKATGAYNLTVSGGEYTPKNANGYVVVLTEGDDEDTLAVPTGEYELTIDAEIKCYPESDYVAEVVNGKKYTSLAEAIAKATAGDTITLLADVTENVTINKNLTIDGAGNTYTGNMTFTNKADITIKKVNFDGKGYNGYAVESKGAYYLTIEDCTAKNYGYGFVQVANGSVLTTVKNVTISNVNYGVKVDYSTAVVLENVDITAAVAAVLNSNYGEKTITIKNSKLNILGTWKRNDTTKTTYVFEGANTIDSFDIDAAIDNFKLAVGATLTAPNDITATATEAGYFVKYADGKYFVAANTVAIDEVTYATLAEALAAAQAGDTIKFLADITEDVTISKAVTIDGAGKTYTGKMTLKANTTIKNVNFDGKGYNGYAVETRGANYLTIEDCTAKNYGYGFVQLASATVLTTVKNVTVSNMNYGVKVDYSSAVVLENVDFTVGVAAVLNSNYGEKTITIKNSKLNILGTWKRNDTIKTTYVFEGANTVEQFKTEAGLDNFKLAVGATLTAPNDITATATEAGYFVKYADGKYFVAANTVAIDEVTYATLAEALAAAQAGDTIKFLADITEDVTISKAVTIDGAGHKYTGTMTGNAGLTITVQNVNFVNGGFDKSTKSATGSYTIKDCTFDGAGTFAYSLRFKGAYAVTVENCTVKNYLYSFLYITSSTNTVSVKNVTVEDCSSYAIYFASGVNSATIEGLTVKNSANGFVINNTANRAFTIKNIKMENVGTAIAESSGTNTITCTVLGNENDFGTAASSQYAKYVLGAAVATLAAPEGYTVTVTEDLKEQGKGVVYEGGKYAVKLTAVAQIGEGAEAKYYHDLQSAINAAVTGDTIVVRENIDLAKTNLQLIDGSYDTYFLVEGKTVTVDLNGKTISGTTTNTKMLVGVFSTDNGGHLKLTGEGTVNVTSNGNVYSLIANYEDECSITIDNGTYTLDNAIDSLLYTGGNEGIIVNGGTFTLGNVGDGTNGKPWIFNALGGNANNVIVNGGTFNADVNHQFWANEVYVPETKALKNNGDGTWTVVNAVANVDETATSTGATSRKVGYADLTEALNAAKSGATVILLTNVTTQLVLVPANVTFDLNGHKLETSYFIGVNGSQVEDSKQKNSPDYGAYDKSTQGTGYIDTDHLTLANKNKQLPVYTDDGVYVLTVPSLFMTPGSKYDLEGLTSLQFLPLFGNGKANEYKNGLSDNELKVVVRLEWTKLNGKVSQDLTYSNNILNGVITHNKPLGVTAKDLSRYQDMSIKILVISDSGVEYCLDQYEFQNTASLD